jgi:indole-3-glycerol phosphate synthase
MSILEEIFAHKQAEIALLERDKPLSAVRREAEAAPYPLDFLAALTTRGRPAPALIAEIKRRSPSRGLLSPAFDPLRLAGLYQQNGAAAVSVLTDERYFGGSLEHLRLVVGALRSGERLTPVPVLRKDFIFHPYQLYEARVAGAAAVLLIAALLSPAQLGDLHALALELGLLPLVEVHREAELAGVLDCQPRLVGINNRDLNTFTVDLATTYRLRPLVPAGIAVVSESGIQSAGDLACLDAAGVDAVLVGEAILGAPEPAAKVRELSGMKEVSYGMHCGQDLRDQNA